jgi:TetR/AcrR family transcriptional regulator, transcriptional repressor for nem operon
VDALAAHLTPDDPQSARGKALGLYTMAVGTLQLSRALSGPEFSDEILELGLQNALAFLGRAPRVGAQQRRGQDTSTLTADQCS